MAAEAGDFSLEMADVELAGESAGLNGYVGLISGGSGIEGIQTGAAAGV